MDKSAVDIQNDLSIISRDSMLKAFTEIWYKDSGNANVGFMYQNKEAPLAYFEECILEDAWDFLKSWNRRENILTYIRKFIGWMLPYMPVGSKKTGKSLKVFDILAGKILESRDYDTWEKNIFRLQRRAFLFICCVRRRDIKEQRGRPNAVEKALGGYFCRRYFQRPDNPLGCGCSL